MPEQFSEPEYVGTPQLRDDQNPPFSFNGLDLFSAAPPKFRSALRLGPLAPLLVALSLQTVLHFYIAGAAGLSYDEAYYRLWSLYPALSYFDHPPLAAWIIAAGRWLAGDTNLGIRLAAPILYVVVGIALFRTTDVLYGRRTAILSSWFALAMPLLSIGGVAVGPDVPSVVFFVLGLWALAELDRSQNPNWWLAVGIFAGLGLLSKYTNLFFGVTVLAWIVCIRANHKWLRCPQLWLGGVIAGALAVPVVVWNAQHSWASFAMQFGRVVRANPHEGHFALEFLGSFVGLASPLIAILAVAGLVSVVSSGFRNRNTADVLLAAAVLPAAIYFCAHTVHDRVHFNWAAPIYPVLAICAVRALELVPNSFRPAAFRSSAAFGFVVTLAIYACAFGSPAGFLGLDPLEQTRNWYKFTDDVDKMRIQNGATWIATSSFRTTGELNFNLKNRAAAIQLNERIRYVDMPPPAEGMLKQPALYVERLRDVDEPLLHQMFAHVRKLGQLVRTYDGTDNGTYGVYLVDAPLLTLDGASVAQP